MAVASRPKGMLLLLQYDRSMDGSIDNGWVFCAAAPSHNFVLAQRTAVQSDVGTLPPGELFYWHNNNKDTIKRTQARRKKRSELPRRKQMAKTGRDCGSQLHSRASINEAELILFPLPSSTWHSKRQKRGGATRRSSSSVLLLLRCTAPPSHQQCCYCSSVELPYCTL